MQKTEKKYYNCSGKEQTAECYKTNKDVIKEKAKNKYKNLTEEEKEAKRQYSKNRYNNGINITIKEENKRLLIIMQLTKKS